MYIKQPLNVNKKSFVVLNVKTESLRVQPCTTVSLLPSPNPHRASFSIRPKGRLKALNLKLQTD